MANPFDQFDETESNPFDQFDVKPTAETESQAGPVSQDDPVLSCQLRKVKRNQFHQHRV